MKMQLALPGETTPTREVERATLIREAVGPDIDLMCDINQRWSVNQAIDIGRRIEDVHLYWLEDVTVHDDYAGLARSQGVEGETVKTLKELEPALRRGVDKTTRENKPYVIDVKVAREGVGADSTWYQDWKM